MITTPLINFAYFLISGFIGWFPAGSGFNETVHNSVIWLGGYLALIDDLVPISTLATIMLLVFSLEIGLFGFRTLKWIISHIPAIGGRG